VIQEAVVEVRSRVQRQRGWVKHDRESRTASSARLAAFHAGFLSREWRNPSGHASILEGSASDWPQEGGEERMSKRTQTHGTLSLCTLSRFGQKETDR